MSVLSRFAFCGEPILLSVSRAVVAMVALSLACVTFAGEPSNNEQFLLEMVNRMRTNPQDELDLLVNINPGPPVTFANPSSGDSAIRNALSSFNVSAATLVSQWQLLTPIPPLAWNTSLGDSAATYSQVMIDEDQQAHNLDEYVDDQGNVLLADRLTASGYVFAGGGWAGENLFAFSESENHAHGAFAIDWGTNPPSGIQDPPGHRDLIMDVRMREIGIGILADNSSATSVGPLVITQHYAAATASDAFLTGVAYDDFNANDFYSPGEGLGQISIVATRLTNGAEYSTTTWDSGGYSLELPPGPYRIVASGPGLTERVLSSVSIGSDNVKIDFLAQIPEPQAIVMAMFAAIPLIGLRRRRRC